MKRIDVPVIGVCSCNEEDNLTSLYTFATANCLDERFLRVLVVDLYGGLDLYFNSIRNSSVHSLMLNRKGVKWFVNEPSWNDTFFLPYEWDHVEYEDDKVLNFIKFLAEQQNIDAVVINVGNNLKMFDMCDYRMFVENNFQDASNKTKTNNFVRWFLQKSKLI